MCVIDADVSWCLSLIINLGAGILRELIEHVEPLSPSPQATL